MDFDGKLRVESKKLNSQTTRLFYLNEQTTSETFGSAIVLVHMQCFINVMSVFCCLLKSPFHEFYSNHPFLIALIEGLLMDSLSCKQYLLQNNIHHSR